MKMNNKMLKLIIIAVLFLLFSLFMGMQAYEFGSGKFFAPFIVTLIFSAFIFLFQVEYYIYAVKIFVQEGKSQAKNFQHPLDIWLITIPMTTLMAITYVLMRWPVVEVFYCTTIALTGMLFGNSLGRGSNKWSIKKSMPFFFGVIMSTLYAVIAGGWLT